MVTVDLPDASPHVLPDHARAGTDPRRFVIVGSGAAGDACAHALREGGFAGAIEMIAPTGPPLDRTMLSKAVLTGDKVPADLILTDAAALADLDVTLIDGEVASVEPGHVVLARRRSPRLGRAAAGPRRRSEPPRLDRGGPAGRPRPALRRRCHRAERRRRRCDLRHLRRSRLHRDGGRAVAHEARPLRHRGDAARRPPCQRRRRGGGPRHHGRARGRRRQFRHRGRGHVHRRRDRGHRRHAGGRADDRRRPRGPRRRRHPGDRRDRRAADGGGWRRGGRRGPLRPRLARGLCRRRLRGGTHPLRHRPDRALARRLPARPRRRAQLSRAGGRDGHPVLLDRARPTVPLSRPRGGLGRDPHGRRPLRPVPGPLCEGRAA